MVGARWLVGWPCRGWLVVRPSLLRGARVVTCWFFPRRPRFGAGVGGALCLHCLEIVMSILDCSVSYVYGVWAVSEVGSESLNCVFPTREMAEIHAASCNGEDPMCDYRVAPILSMGFTS